MAQVNGKDVKTKISIDAGVTYLDLVCETSGGIEITSSPTTTATKCGTKTAAGVPEWSIPIEGLVETVPAGTEISYEQLLAAIINGTALKVKILTPDPAGTDFYHQGDCVLTDLSLSLPADDYASFTGTLSGNSTLDITP
jgi:predicted secreted protein